MSTTTPNLGLIKQTGSENYSIDVVNGNLDLIDSKCVNTNGEQNIPGAKTFTDNRIRIAFDGDKYLTLRRANNTTDTHSIAFYNNGLIGLYPGRESGKTKAVVIDGQRTYDATHQTDIVTIGTLQGSTDVVHRSGNEDISGVKKFSNLIYAQCIGQYIRPPSNASANGKWKRWISLPNSYNGRFIEVANTVANNNVYYALFKLP